MVFLAKGHGCFWELFDPDWGDLMHIGQKAPTRPSFCHPWSAGATPFLSKYVLGVQPVTPGFESVTVTPFVSAAWPVQSEPVFFFRSLVRNKERWKRRRAPAQGPSTEVLTS